MAVKTKKSILSAEWRKKNPDKAKNWNLQKNYGITINDFNEMYVQQEGKCGICSGSIKRAGMRYDSDVAVVDHCHTTKKVRGLLCHNCNRGLGYFKDNPELLEAAKGYLLE